MKQPHIRLSEEETARYAILPGDPERVGRVASHLTKVKELAFNREYCSLTGFIGETKVLVMSTGMGGASTGIGVEELHNIGVEAMIRIGSCGALQRQIRLGDLILANGAVRDDGASRAYIEHIFPAVPDHELLSSLIEAARILDIPHHVGIIRSHDSFYTDREEEIDAYWSKQGVLGADMETAALFTIGSLRGIRCASILNTVVEYEGELKEGVGQYTEGQEASMRGEADEIRTALLACELMEQKHALHV